MSLSSDFFSSLLFFVGTIQRRFYMLGTYSKGGAFVSYTKINSTLLKKGMHPIPSYHPASEKYYIDGFWD